MTATSWKRHGAWLSAASPIATRTETESGVLQCVARPNGIKGLGRVFLNAPLTAAAYFCTLSPSQPDYRVTQHGERKPLGTGSPRPLSSAGRSRHASHAPARAHRALRSKADAYGGRRAPLYRAGAPAPRRGRYQHP